MSQPPPETSRWTPTGQGVPQRPGGHQSAPAQGSPASAATPTRPDGSRAVRPMPMGDDDRSFEAIALGSQLTSSSDQDRFVAPPVHQEVTRRRFPVKAVGLTLVLTLVVGIGLGVVWVRYLRTEQIDQDTIVQPTATTSGQTAGRESSVDVVQSYLTALSEGDVETALTFGANSATGSTVLLTNEAYAAMPEGSWPSNIQILTQDANATEVKAQYTLAGDLVTASYRTVRQEDDTYKLQTNTVTATWQISGGDNLPLRINGIEVNHTQSIQLVPGVYQLGTGLPFVSFPDATQVIQSLSFTEDPIFPVNAELTPEGRAAFLARARDSLSECLRRRSAAPEGCPNQVRVPQEVNASTVQWRLTNDPWTNFNASLQADDQSRATATIPLTLEVTMDYANGQHGGTTPVALNAQLSANVLGSDPQRVNIVWST